MASIRRIACQSASWRWRPNELGLIGRRQDHDVLPHGEEFAPGALPCGGFP